MTISHDPSAPLIVVVGATGQQGGSVIKALSASDKPYRFRGITRDASKPAAQALVKQGVDMVSVSMTLENKEQASRAFEGATYAFVSRVLNVAFQIYTFGERLSWPYVLV